MRKREKGGCPFNNSVKVKREIVKEGAMRRLTCLDTPGVIHHVIMRGIERRRRVRPGVHFVSSKIVSFLRVSPQSSYDHGSWSLSSPAPLLPKAVR